MEDHKNQLNKILFLENLNITVLSFINYNEYINGWYQANK